MCRVAWAGLELRAGNLDDCRQLLREGLDQHPDYPAALLLTAQLERRCRNFNLAEAYARRALKVGWEAWLGVWWFLLGSAAAWCWLYCPELPTCALRPLPASLFSQRVLVLGRVACRI